MVVLRAYKSHALLELTIREGRNRQVRRMLRAVGSKVDALARTRVGPIELGDLARGAWRELGADEVGALRASVRVPRTAQ